MRTAALFLFFALAACGSNERESAAASPSPFASSAVPEVPATPDNPDAEAFTTAIPARYLGVWDNEAAPCEPPTDSRLEVAARTIGFYESHGAVSRVTELQDGSVLVDLAMEGEGETWNTAVKLQLTGSGEAERLLSLPDPDSGILVRPVRLKRCPA